MGESSVPGFRRISFVDAYLFKIVYIFAPFLFLLVLYNVVTGRPAEDSMLPFVFLAVLVCVIYVRWSAIVAAFNDHITIACRIANISPGGGLLGLHIFVSFFVSCDGENAERGCSLARFNPLVKKLKKGDVINVFWNQRKNIYVIKEAYLDD